MSEYLHGAYAYASANGNRIAARSDGAVVCVGTAPVQTIALASGESYNVNTPVVVNNIAEARAFFGYSKDWAKYTLCEAMHHFLETKAVGPLILINVLDPVSTHKSSTATTASKTPSGGKIVLASAEDIILDSVVITTTGGSPTTKEKGVDYNIAYNAAKETIEIVSIGDGLGTDALTLTYYTVTPNTVAAADIVGATDGLGTNTGLYAINDVYNKTGMIPAYLIVPGWSSNGTVHAAMANVTKKVNGHWDMWMFTDLPLLNGSTPLTLATVAEYKAQNGFTCENESVYFPMAAGTDGNKYHLSVLAAANFQELLADNEGIPYHSASNTEAGIIKDLYMGEANVGKVFDDQMINKYLNKNGINSAAFVGGRWVIWGAHAADYNQTDANEVNVAETNRMMLYYLGNDFQKRRPVNVDQPLTANDIASIAAEEQQRLDALVAIGALIFGEASINADPIARSDVYRGDFVFAFRVTVTPLAKSLTAYVTWASDGFETYYTELTEA